MHQQVDLATVPFVTLKQLKPVEILVATFGLAILLHFKLNCLQLQ
jgi:hypothetical protein